MSSEAVGIIAQAIHDECCGCESGHCAEWSWAQAHGADIISALLAAGTVEYGVQRPNDGHVWSGFLGEPQARRAREGSSVVVQRRVFPLTEDWRPT